MLNEIFFFDIIHFPVFSSLPPSLVSCSNNFGTQEVILPFVSLCQIFFPSFFSQFFKGKNMEVQSKWNKKLISCLNYTPNTFLQPESLQIYWDSIRLAKKCKNCSPLFSEGTKVKKIVLYRLVPQQPFQLLSLFLFLV